MREKKKLLKKKDVQIRLEIQRMWKIYEPVAMQSIQESQQEVIE